MTDEPHNSSADVEALDMSRPLATSLAGLPRSRADWWNRLRDAGRRLARAHEPDEAAHLETACRVLLDRIEVLEAYHAFPGMPAVTWLRTLLSDDRSAFADAVIRIGRVRAAGTYRRIDLAGARVTGFLDLLRRDHRAFHAGRTDARARPYFEVLVVEDSDESEMDEFRRGMRALRRSDDRFHYEVVAVRSFEDALVAVLANPDIAVVLTRFGFPFASATADSAWLHAIYRVLGVERSTVASLRPGSRSGQLGGMLARLRPELDLFRVTDAPVEALVGEGDGAFRRVFYQSEDLPDLHVSILRGVAERYDTPFFDALRRYAERPTGMFHALPLSRGRTVAKSHWIQDFGDFYGDRLFQAETSATTGGLDSLLQPTGSLRDAQTAAARAFGSQRTFFVTNGTSTANKIVMQALVQPRDVVLLGHDCHKSHPYAVILAGAYPVVLDGYALDALSMYGGVPLRTLVTRLLTLRDLGQLDRVRVVLLTNLTFDGVTYDPFRIMRAVLAIHPTVAFLWDEAWFAYGRFSPLTRSRTAMAAAQRLAGAIGAPEAQVRHAAWCSAHDPDDPDAYLDDAVFPDPARARVRVYATHSTHKTLTALRQGSMIHVYDQDYERQVEQPFNEAYMTHTSTSPNYQILASLDVGRRQVELEGTRLVSESIDLALLLRERIRNDPLLARYFRVCGPEEMIPEEHRPSGLTAFVKPDGSVAALEDAWQDDAFVLDPTRVTLHVGRTGRDGDTFKRLLMDDYQIHINKTSRNTVLFLIHIGAARGTVAHLVKVLAEIAQGLEAWLRQASPGERAAFERRVRALTDEVPPLPNFSHFHPAFVPPELEGSGAGDMRTAYFLAYDPETTTTQPLDDALAREVADGRVVVSASFVTPYPPGYPVAMPGQVITRDILDYLLALDTREIHGLHPKLGLRLFRDEALAALGAPADVPRAAAPDTLPAPEPAP